MRFFRRTRVEAQKSATTEEPAAPPHGPSWMSADDWSRRLIAYQRQGRSDADIREVARHLERRGQPWTPAKVIAHATGAGYVAREEYLSPEDETRALAPGEAGWPDARLQLVRDRLLVVTPLGWVNPRSRIAYRAGLYSFKIAGTSYYEAALKAGRFTPGALLRLVREPGNAHDTNAIAVYAERARSKGGYVPKGHAIRLARLLDSDVELVAVSTRGSGTGTEGVVPNVLVCERALMQHLDRA